MCDMTSHMPCVWEFYDKQHAMDVRVCCGKHLDASSAACKPQANGCTRVL